VFHGTCNLKPRGCKTLVIAVYIPGMAITKITDKIKCKEVKYLIAYFMEDSDHLDISFRLYLEEI